MALFKIKERVQQKSEELVEKVEKSSNLLKTIKEIKERVKDLKYPHKVVYDEKELETYLYADEVATDIETTGLSYLKDEIVGMSFYREGMLPIYVPMNHVDYVTRERLENQLTNEQVSEILKNAKCKFILHNARFDLKFIQHHLRVKLKVFWDTLFAGRLLNENEDSHGLKDLYAKYISKEKGSKFNELYNGITYENIPIPLASCYASFDAQMTWELKQFQAKHLREDNKKGDLDIVYHYFMNYEMPLLNVVLQMEMQGVPGDKKRANELKEKYTKLKEEHEIECIKYFNHYTNEVNAYNEEAKQKNFKIEEENKKKKKEDKLPKLQIIDFPINLNSPSQLQVFLFDILKLETEDKSTGVDELKKLDHPFVSALLEYRTAEKMLGTFILPLIDYMKIDGNIHGEFKQLSTLTGRFSSSNPNLQNIPSRNSEIRNIFCGGTQYKEYEDANYYEFEKCEEIIVDGNWKWVELLKVGDKIESGIVEKVEVEKGWEGKVKIWIRGKINE